MAVGLIAFLVIPVMTLLLAFTIIGLPLAPLSFFGYLLLLFFGCFTAIFYVGDQVLNRLFKNKEKIKNGTLYQFLLHQYLCSY
jgi:lipopolysaccharide export LptBFGC system permease protein LptF